MRTIMNSHGVMHVHCFDALAFHISEPIGIVESIVIVNLVTTLFVSRM